MTVSPVSPSTYPASDPGFAALPLADLLAGEADLIGRIKLCYGTDQDSFERDVLSLVRRYASCVHLLPATADNYFNKPGGLLRLGLETAFFSLQGTDAHIFSGRLSITARRQLEPRWRHATFIAGLCCELHRVMSHVIVTDGGGETWPAFLQPLADWVAARCSERYYLRWRPQATETRGLTLFVLPHVVPASTMADLCEGNMVIVPHLLASLSGVPLHRDHNILDELVRRSLALVIDRNLAASADRYGTPQYGSHLERYLIDALRRLAAGNSAWVPNRERSRLWVGQDGLFLVWPGAAEDVCKLLETDQLAGIPKAPETMLELLLAAGVLEAAAPDRSTWLIQLPSNKAPLEAVKLSNPAILLAGIHPPPVALPQALAVAPTRPHDNTTRPSPPTALQPLASFPPSAVVEHGDQLSLIPNFDPLVPDAPPSSAPATDGMPSELSEAVTLMCVSPVPAPAFVLQAPMRLNPLVRDALAEAVDSLNEDFGPPTVCAVAQGLFVPLETFARRGVQPSVAMRALADTNMLVMLNYEGPPTVTREFNGKPALGIVLEPRFVDGLDLAAFDLSPAKQSSPQERS